MNFLNHQVSVKSCNLHRLIMCQWNRMELFCRHIHIFVCLDKLATFLMKDVTRYANQVSTDSHTETVRFCSRWNKFCTEWVLTIIIRKLVSQVTKILAKLRFWFTGDREETNGIWKSKEEWGMKFICKQSSPIGRIEFMVMVESWQSDMSSP